MCRADFELGTGFNADGAVIHSDHYVFATDARPAAGHVEPGAGHATAGGRPQRPVADGLRRLLPPDVVVLTRPEIYSPGTDALGDATSVGIIFGLGVVLAVIVGVGVVYQVLASDIDNRLSEYATLKAMGLRPATYLGRVLRGHDAGRGGLLAWAAGLQRAVMPISSREPTCRCK